MKQAPFASRIVRKQRVLRDPPSRGNERAVVKSRIVIMHRYTKSSNWARDTVVNLLLTLFC